MSSVCLCGAVAAAWRRRTSWTMARAREPIERQAISAPRHQAVFGDPGQGDRGEVAVAFRVRYA